MRPRSVCIYKDFDRKPILNNPNPVLKNASTLSIRIEQFGGYSH